MLITKETDYAFRIIRALMVTRFMTIQAVCEHEKIPKQFAYKILKKLKNSGLVGIKRGSHGGCFLVIDPQDITLLDIIKALDEDFFLTHCMRPGFQCEYMENVGDCGIHREMVRIQQIMETEFCSFTMENLIHNHK